MATDFVQRPVRILHLEDNENDHILVREMLQADGLPREVVPVKSRDDFDSALRRDKYDLIISDYTLPSFDGLRALSPARAVCPETPFIFFSGTIGEEAAVESLRNGAVDYVLKQRPSRLAPAGRRAWRSRQGGPCASRRKRHCNRCLLRQAVYQRKPPQYCPPGAGGLNMTRPGPTTSPTGPFDWIPRRPRAPADFSGHPQTSAVPVCLRRRH